MMFKITAIPTAYMNKYKINKYLRKRVKLIFEMNMSKNNLKEKQS